MIRVPITDSKVIEIDVERNVKAGAWLFDRLAFYGECSCCGETTYNKPSKYCPECGAMMVNYEPAQMYYNTIVDAMAKQRSENDG